MSDVYAFGMFVGCMCVKPVCLQVQIRLRICKDHDVNGVTVMCMGNDCVNIYCGWLAGKKRSINIKETKN